VSLSYRIFLDRGLVYVRYGSRVDFSDSGALFAAYTRDPDFRPGQKHLVDFSAVTDIDTDYARLLAVQAAKADAFVFPTGETLMVYFAPTPETDRVARWALRTWEGVNGVVVRVLNDEAAALSFLGQPEESFADLFESADP
jgi:hypothetical protein